jgi:hypothetical protein
VASDARDRQVAGGVIHYLVDSSALWRILREPAIRAGWSDVVTDHGMGSCQPQRAEFRRSARNEAEYEQMSAMFNDLYPDVPLPKNTWQWVESAQHGLVRAGAHRALSCGQRSARWLLHDWSSFATITTSPPRPSTSPTYANGRSAAP